MKNLKYRLLVALFAAATASLLAAQSMEFQLKDAVDHITLLGRSLLDPGNQQSIDRSQLLARLITLSSRSTGHCATSLQADPNRELVPRDYAKCTQVASSTHDQSRAKLAAVINAAPRSWYRTSFL